jgi:hypothetical protein
MYNTSRYIQPTSLVHYHDEHQLLLSSKYSERDVLRQNDPCNFTVILPADCAPSLMIMNQHEPPKSFEIVQLLASGIMNCNREEIVIHQKFISEPYNWHQISFEIPQGTFTEEKLVETINEKTGDFFQLNWFSNNTVQTNLDRIQLTSNLTPAATLLLQEAHLTMSTILAAKLGWLIPDMAHPMARKNFTVPLLPRCDVERMDEQRGGVAELDPTATADSTTTPPPPQQQQQQEGANNDTDIQHLLTSSQSLPNCTTSNTTRLPLFQGQFLPSVCVNLHCLDLIIEQPNLELFPNTKVGPSFDARTSVNSVAKFFISPKSWEEIQPNHIHLLEPTYTQTKKIVNLKSTRLNFKLVDSCGARFPLSMNGELQVICKIINY